MWYNRVVIWLLQSQLHGVLSGSTLVITYQGRISGKLYHVPVNYVRSGEKLLVTSKRDRTWWRSLEGGQRVEVCLRGKNVPMQGQVLQVPAEAQAGLASYLGIVPQQARYFGVGLDSAGRPLAADLAASVKDRVIIELQFQS